MFSAVGRRREIEGRKAIKQKSVFYEGRWRRRVGAPVCVFARERRRGGEGDSTLNLVSRDTPTQHKRKNLWHTLGGVGMHDKGKKTFDAKYSFFINILINFYFLAIKDWQYFDKLEPVQHWQMPSSTLSSQRRLATESATQKSRYVVSIDDFVFLPFFVCPSAKWRVVLFFSFSPPLFIGGPRALSPVITGSPLPPRASLPL